MDTDSVGTILYRGTKSLMQVPTIDGESRAQEVCQGFPEIAVSQAGASNGPGGGVKLRLDFNECLVVVDELTRTSIGVGSMSDSRPAGLRTLAWPSWRTANQVQMAWSDGAAEHEESSVGRFGAPERRSQLIGAIEDWLQLDLTRVEINRSFRLALPLQLGHFKKSCESNSIWRDHIRWHSDECIGEQSLVAGQARAWARGRFHATVIREGTTMNRDSRHTIYLHLEGSANGDVVRSCTFSPYSIRRLTATFAPSWQLTDLLFFAIPGPYRVFVDCRYRNR